MTTTAEKMKAYEEALQKVVDDSDIGCVPASHISHIKRLLMAEPKILYINTTYSGMIHAFSAYSAAVSCSDSFTDTVGRRYIELTPELEKLAKEGGLL